MQQKKIWRAVSLGSICIFGISFGCAQYLRYQDAPNEGLLSASSPNPITPITIVDIYNYLKKNFPQYENITYAAPSTNILRANNWLLQTPDIWGFTLEQYNQVYASANLDPCFSLPTCAVDSDCKPSGAPTFPATCVSPNFLTQAVTGCPNNTSDAAGTKLCLSNAHKIITDLYSAIIGAQHSIDISMLNTGDNFLTTQQFDANAQPLGTQSPDAFYFVLKQALTELANTSTNAITVRLLGGSYSNSGLALPNTQNFLKNITSNFNAGNKITIVAVPERSCPTLFGSCDNPYAGVNDIFDASWNHGKNIVIDQNIVFAGGENLWGGDYLSANPTNDAYFRLEGPVAKGATVYNNSLFTYLSTLYSSENRYTDQCYVYQNGTIVSQNPCSSNWGKSQNLIQNSPSLSNGDISVSAMYVSKLNGDILNIDADQSEPARVYAISNASQSVKIAQQSLFIKGMKFNPSTFQPLADGTIWPAAPGSVTPNPIATMNAIATVFNKNIKNKTNVTVNILTTSFSQYDGYGADVELSYIYNFLCSILTKTFGNSATVAQSQLSSNLKLGYVSYNNGVTSNGTPSHHNKFWMVDDRIFYFGSHNFYPSPLQQFGIITDNTQAASELLTKFWNPLWSNADSSTSAFDPSTVKCTN